MVLFVLILNISLFSESIFDSKRFVSFGSGNYIHNEKEFIAELRLNLGFKNDRSKLYFSMPYIYFLDKNENELEIAIYSINYAYYFYKYKNISIFGDIGLGMANIEKKVTQYSHSFFELNGEIGIDYKINNHWSFNTGLKFYNINDNEVNNFHGFSFNIEYKQ